MLHFWRKSRTKRSFWRLGASILEEVSYEALVLETWPFTFGGSLVCFGDLALHFWRKSRTKRSYWRLGPSLLEEVSYETLVLEIWPFTLGGGLVRSARFGDLALYIWRNSCEALVLETWPFTFGGSLVRSSRFGDLVLHSWRKSRTKRSFWRLGPSLLEEVPYEALVLETWPFTFGGSLVRSARFGDLATWCSYEALVLETWCFTFGGSLVRSARFGLHFWRKSRTKRLFWRLGCSLLEEVSYGTLVLETWRFTFGGSLVRSARLTWRFTFGGSLVPNARFAYLALHFWRKSRTKRSFWRLGALLLEEVSYEALVLETWCFTFGGSLVRNARFGDLAGDLALHFWRKSRTKRSFWRLGASLLEEVSYETLVLETWCFTFGGRLVRNARFGLVALHFWRKSRTKRSLWRLGASLLEEVSYKTLVLETWCFTFGGSLVRSARFGDLVLHFWRKSRTKRSFWSLGASLLEEVLYEAFVLETWRFTFGGSLIRNACCGDFDA